MVRLATWVGTACICACLALASAAAARTRRLYIAVGDSVTNSGVPGAGWVDLYYRYLQAETHGGATRFVRLSSGTSGLMLQRGGGVDQTIKLIDEPSNTIAASRSIRRSVPTGPRTAPASRSRSQWASSMLARAPAGRCGR